jgi:hypothetical protein
MAGKIDGIALGSIAAGGLLVYAGIKGKSVPSLLTGFIQGKPPGSATAANAITGPTAADNTASGAGVITTGSLPSGSGQAALQAAAAAHGWGSGAQWQALSNVEMAEAGFNPQATNGSSGAYGLAQALGHGNGAATQGTVTNEYGGFGLTDAQAQAANSGDAGAQAVWMVNYIAATYGTPEAAWAHEQANHWY